MSQTVKCIRHFSDKRGRHKLTQRARPKLNFCLGFRFARGQSKHSSQQLTRPAAHSLCLPGGVRQLWWSLSPRSVWPIFWGVRSAWACQAAQSSVQEVGPTARSWRPSLHVRMAYSVGQGPGDDGAFCPGTRFANVGSRHSGGKNWRSLSLHALMRLTETPRGS